MSLPRVTWCDFTDAWNWAWRYQVERTHGTSEGLWKIGCGVEAVHSVSALDLGVILIME